MPIVSVPFVLGGGGVSLWLCPGRESPLGGQPQPKAHCPPGEERRGGGGIRSQLHSGSKGWGLGGPLDTGVLLGTGRGALPTTSCHSAAWDCAPGGTRSAPPCAQGTEASDCSRREPAERKWWVSKLSAEPADKACTPPSPRAGRFRSDSPGRVPQVAQPVSRSCWERTWQGDGGPNSSSVGGPAALPPKLMLRLRVLGARRWWRHSAPVARRRSPRLPCFFPWTPKRGRSLAPSAGFPGSCHFLDTPNSHLVGRE